ncbi:MAG: hypothetical protein A2046_01525 [Bacteroidetes bacterium GWA2_30_7]|nr:MAG: hypothetical protein A2046_01525 [Bacteroidetes bacterium GWA2_30_7]
MSIEEKQKIKEHYYTEAIRYMNNAKETLKKAGKDGDFYEDRKYVRTATGTAYNGVLIALDGYLLIKGVERKKGRKSIEYYQKSLSEIDKKLLKYLNSAYDTLHLSGYYDGNLSVKVILSGFEVAYEIINKIKTK